MARNIQKIYELSIRVKAMTALHVGGLGGDVESDAVLAVDGQDRYCIPATGIAGIFRKSAKRYAKNGDAFEALWGSSIDDGDRKEFSASLISFSNAVLGRVTDLSPEVRDGVRIDSCSGTAAHEAKYDRMVLPKGHQFDLKLSVEITDEKTDDEFKSEIGGILAELAEGWVRIGGSKSRGLGRVQSIPEHVKVYSYDMTTPEGVVQWLKRTGNPVSLEQTAVGNWLVPYEIGWETKQPVLVKAEGSAPHVDTIPLSTGGDCVWLVIPGSSIKGVLRHRAEFIMKSRGEDVELVKWVFGAAADDRGNRAGPNDPEQGQAALYVDDCHSTLAVKPEDFLKMIESDERKRLLEGWRFEVVDHVAIDRWTGGAVESRLFNVLEPSSVEWEPWRMYLDLSRIPEKEHNRAQALIYAVLRDVANGWVPIGKDTTRGLGDIKLLDERQWLGNQASLDTLQMAWTKKEVKAAICTDAQTEASTTR